MASWSEYKFVLREPVAYPNWIEAGRLADTEDVASNYTSRQVYRGRDVVTCDLCWALVSMESFHMHANWHTEQNLA